MEKILINSTEVSAATEKLFEAMAGDDKEQLKAAFGNYAEALASELSKKVSAEQQEYADARHDDAVLAERGIGGRRLTTKEMKFFNEAAAKQTLDGLKEQFPETIVEDVWRELEEKHPLISLVDTKHTGPKLKYTYGDPAKETAFWGPIPENIRQILLGAFKTLNLEHSKLSGFIALPKGYFELGPKWLANYVVTFLHEVMAAAIETAIVNGDGKNKPLGMMRKLSGSSDGVYPEKEKVTVVNFEPATLAGTRALLAEEKTDNGKVYAVVHPTTYWLKVFPAIAFKTKEGAWVTTQLPTGEEIVTSYAVPKNVVVVGVLKNYLLAVSSKVSIEVYKETLAIEDLDVYIAKFFGTGIAKNPNAFVVWDIQTIQGGTGITAEKEAVIEAQDNINPEQKMKNKGEYKAGENYEIGDIVRDKKNLYVATKKVTAASKAPSEDATNWKKI